MRRRLAAFAILVLAGVVFLVWQSCGGTPPRTAAPASPPTPIALATPRVQRPELPAPPVAGTPPMVPLIDEVTVEKTEVCDGEETLVSVRAHTPGGAEDAYLHYMVGAEMGAQAPLRIYARDNSEGEPPPLVVRVFGRNNVTAEAPVPPIRVKDCKPTRRLHVIARVLPNTIDTFELVTKIVDVSAPAPMRPVEWRWNFGDGSSDVSRGPTIVHDFSGRPQDTLYSQLLVTAEAVAADGERLVGRAALQLLNPSYEHLAYRGVVLLYATMTPRFPEVGSDGFVRQRVHLWHRHRSPVAVTRILRYAHGADGSSGPPEEVDPVALFGGSLIGPGGVDGKVELDAAAGVFSYELAIEGKSQDGHPAMGAFSLMRPPDRPTRDNSTPVVDPLLKAKIVRARELLHQDYVTDEDLIRLSEEGAFDDLIREAAGKPPSDLPAPLPPAPPK
jgi:hypothetical protein